MKTALIVALVLALFAPLLAATTDNYRECMVQCCIDARGNVTNGGLSQDVPGCQLPNLNDSKAKEMLDCREACYYNQGFMAWLNKPCAGMFVLLFVPALALLARKR